jgi:hypothetical protein
LATGPFDELERVLEFALALELEFAGELPTRELVRFGLPDEPFRLVDLDLEPLRLERVLDDRVVWAIVLVTPRLPCQLRFSRRR